MARTNEDMAAELLALLTAVARDGGYVIPTRSPADTDLTAALIVARSIRFGWTEPGRHRDEDDTPTVQFPPIGQTVRRRPPVPPARVQELTDRVELLQALGRELQRELGELRAVDEDQADDDDAAGEDL